MNSIFSNCKNILSLPDISNWDTSKVKDMTFMFYNCSSLNTLPNIKKFKLDYVSNISGIFAECSNINSIPDISNWFITITYDLKFFDNYVIPFDKDFGDINEYEDNFFYFRYMFYNCKSLKFLPDISKWDTKKCK